jgi:hypothetical protein
MKKSIYLLLSLVLMLPVIVSAEVKHDTDIKLVGTREECLQELELNEDDDNKSASEGYYLSCIAVSCKNGLVSYDEDLEPFEENVTCANGNKNPYTYIVQSAFSQFELEENASCSLNEADENYFDAKFGTFVTRYNCLLNGDGSVYKSTSNNDTGGNPTGGNSDKEPNPQTGINTYYTVLGSSVVILSIGLYIINKKNLFKKI